jgi:hypothetical protein
MNGMVGWKDLGCSVGRIYLDMKEEEPTFIFGNSYQTTSELAFHVVGPPETRNVNLGRRLNQHDSWEGFGELVEWNAVYVYEGDAPLHPCVERAFDRCQKETSVHIERFRLPVRSFFPLPVL